MNIALRTTTPADLTTIAHLLQLLLHDLSEVDKQDVQADGLFPHAPLDPYWHAADHAAF